jgi:hypothetical protein
MQYRDPILLFLALFFAFFVPADAQTVKGSFTQARVTRGSTAKGQIVLDIPDGLHVNSSKPNSEYAIPTSVKIETAGLKPIAVEYPEGTDRKFQFSESELNVYEGEVVIPFSITVPKRFRGERLAVKAVVQYQACTEEVCFPPKNKELIMTAAVK